MDRIESPTSPTPEPPTEPLAVLREAFARFGDGLVLATSLGPQSLVIIDLLHREGLGCDVVLVDTGLLFAETLELKKRVEAHFDLRIRSVTPERSVGEQAEAEGPELWLHDPDRCCQLRKVEPMRRALAGYRAWITGLRRDQSATRADYQPIGWDGAHDLFKVSPLLDWDREMVRDYLSEHGVPYNPLLDRGYPSIGCAPCTQAVPDHLAITDERAGRWSGREKTECGLHRRLPLAAPGAAARPSGKP